MPYVAKNISLPAEADKKQSHSASYADNLTLPYLIANPFTGLHLSRSRRHRAPHSRRVGAGTDTSRRGGNACTNTGRL
jgi:hypothetical protein